jgi:hypothetical protein
VGRELNRGSKPQTTINSKPQTTTVVQTTAVVKPQTGSVSHENPHNCKPKHNKGKGWAKGHDKHC